MQSCDSWIVGQPVDNSATDTAGGAYYRDVAVFDKRRQCGVRHWPLTDEFLYVLQHALLHVGVRQAPFSGT